MTKSETLRSNWEKIAELHRKLEAILEWPDELLLAEAPEVSGWSPAAHVHHLGMANRAAGTTLARLDSGKGEGPGELGELATQMFAANHIPRGKKAPETVLPPPSPGREETRAALAKAVARFEPLEGKLDSLAERGNRLPHPILGPMDADEWLRFIVIHTNHHLAIIEDIRQALAKA